MKPLSSSLFSPSLNPPPPLAMVWAGECDYQRAWEWQKELVAAHATDPDTPDKLLLLTHPPTFTFGRRGQADHLLWTADECARRGIGVHWVDRGGDITYHGPGQLVGYPILNLKRLAMVQGESRPDLHHYLRQIEEVLILLLAHFGLVGGRRPHFTGVWVDDGHTLAKIAAIGVRVNGRGISSHGFALNVNPNLTHFEGIVPCGITEYGVTSMTALLGYPVTVADCLPVVQRAWQQLFALEVTPLSTYNL